MTTEQPDSISAVERTRRLKRITEIARRYGFVGRIEYRHVFSSAGGAQFGLGPKPSLDLLVVYAEAFLRDDNPDDFSLEAIIAHERGHQVIDRNPRLQALLTESVATTAEEILASLVGSLIVERSADREALVLKALDDILGAGASLDDGLQVILELRSFVEKAL